MLSVGQIGADVKDRKNITLAPGGLIRLLFSEIALDKNFTLR